MLFTSPDAMRLGRDLESIFRPNRSSFEISARYRYQAGSGRSERASEKKDDIPGDTDSGKVSARQLLSANTGGISYG